MPKGKSLWNQLLSSNRRRSKGSLEKAQGLCWAAIRLADAGILRAAEAEDTDDVRKWMSSLHQLLHVYVKLASAADLEVRVAELEARLK